MYWLTGALGAIIAIAPFVLRYNNNAAAMWTSVILGLAVVVLSVMEAMDTTKSRWEYWAAGLIGILALAAPFVLGFSTLTTAMWMIVGFGILVAILSGIEIFATPTTR